MAMQSFSKEGFSKEGFENKVAVITGAGSGIGLGLLRHCAAQRMRIVALDVSAERLADVSAELNKAGIEHWAQSCNVADSAQVEQVASEVFARFGAVHLLFNNAGILRNGLSWECSVEDWRRVMEINLLGAVHCVRAFVPRMLQGGEAGHIVNTASMAGLLASPLMGPYTVSKHALVALSETLLYDLQSVQARIGVSVLCPGQVASNIMDSVGTSSTMTAGLNDFLRQGIDQGMSPLQVAEQVFAAVREQRFWIFTHPEFKPAYRQHSEALLEERNPVYEQVICD